MARLREWLSYEIGMPLVLDVCILAGLAYLGWLVAGL